MQPIEEAPSIGLRQPYPGLRPFEPDEAMKFYGRETHTVELLRRLSENRFIAVVGSSGSGKSSLVRAGLLPALYRGRLIGATSQWRICMMRPGDAPMKSLAESLAERKVFSNDEDAVQDAARRCADEKPGGVFGRAQVILKRRRRRPPGSAPIQSGAGARGAGKPIRGGREPAAGGGPVRGTVPFREGAEGTGWRRGGAAVRGVAAGSCRSLERAGLRGAHHAVGFHG